MVLFPPVASATSGGALTTGSQTISGAKTFTSEVLASALGTTGAIPFQGNGTLATGGRLYMGSLNAQNAGIWGATSGAFIPTSTNYSFLTDNGGGFSYLNASTAINFRIGAVTKVAINSTGTIVSSVASGSDAVQVLDGSHLNLSTADTDTYLYRHAANTVGVPNNLRVAGDTFELARTGGAAIAFSGSGRADISASCSAVNATSLLPAIRIRNTVALDANDLVFAVQNNVGNILSVDYEGDLLASGILSIVGVSPITTNVGDLGSSSKQWQTANIRDFRDASNILRLQFLDVTGTSYIGRSADGASAVAHTFSNNQTLSTTGAKIASFVNSTEKAFIDKDGAFSGSGVITTGNTGGNIGMSVATNSGLSLNGVAIGSVGTAGSTFLIDDGTDFRINYGSQARLRIDHNNGTVTSLLGVTVGSALIVGTSVTLSSFTDDSATTGSRVVNKVRGISAFAASTSTITITNSFVTATSTVLAVLQTADATAVLKNVVPGAGSFVINLTANTTGITKVSWVVLN